LTDGNKNLVLALLHQPIKFVRFHIGSVKAVLALIFFRIGPVFRNYCFPILDSGQAKFTIYGLIRNS